MDRVELVRIIDSRLADLDLSAAEASRRAVSNQYMVRNIKERGSVPTLEAASKLLSVLGMDLVAVPRGQDMSAKLLDTPIEVEFVEPALEHRGLASCGVSGWGKPEAMADLPRPSNLSDESAFYVEAAGPSMEPEGISDGDVVLVSPSTAPLPGDRVYVEDREGRGAIKRLINVTDDKLYLRGWLDQPDKRQAFNETRFREYVTTLGTVVAVFGETPSKDQQIAQKTDPMDRSNRSPIVPLIGSIANGAQLQIDLDMPSGEFTAAPPTSTSGGLGAIAVSGNALSPVARDGGTIFIDVSRPFKPSDCIGELIVAQLNDGTNHLKILRRGDDGIHWNLESTTQGSGTLTNVELGLVFPVRFVAH